VDKLYRKKKNKYRCGTKYFSYKEEGKYIYMRATQPKNE
jgi:hypothetical protein